MYVIASFCDTVCGASARVFAKFTSLRRFRFISHVAIYGWATKFLTVVYSPLQPSWMRSREYWDDSFEARFAELRKDPTRPPLKVS